MKTKSIIRIILFCIFLFVVLLGFVFYKRHTVRMADKRCYDNLKKIGLAMKQYAMDYKDYFPIGDDFEGLSLLVEDGYLKNSDISTTYKYHSGYDECGSKPTGNPDLPLCWDIANNYKNYGYVVFADGHVERLEDEEWIKFLNHIKNQKRFSPFHS